MIRPCAGEPARIGGERGQPDRAGALDHRFFDLHQLLIALSMSRSGASMMSSTIG